MGHSHSHLESQRLNKSFAIAVLLNFSFTVVEAIYAILGNSMSLLADAGHNLGDVTGLALAWGANWLLTRPSGDRYSYGYKRTSILAAMLNALILVATSAIIAYESISKLFYPEHVNEMIVIVVALIGIFINGGTALMFMKGRSEDLNVKGAFLHLAADALISIGVVITGIIILLTNQWWVDPFVGLIIVVLILTGSWGLLRDSVNLMLDAVPHHVDQNKVRDYLLKIPGVADIHDLHIWGLSTKMVALTVHLTIPDRQLTDDELQEIHRELHRSYSIDHATIQVERGKSDSVCQVEKNCH